MSDLPPGWRRMTVHQLRAWLKASEHHMPYVLYARKDHIITWIEQHVECQRARCPTCGQPI